MSQPSEYRVILTSVLVLILWTSLFVNVIDDNCSLINSVHQIIYYVVWCIAGSDWREFCIDFFCLSILCSFVLFNLLYFVLPYVRWNKVLDSFIHSFVSHLFISIQIWKTSAARYGRARISFHPNINFTGGKFFTESFTRGRKPMGHPWWRPHHGRSVSRDKQTNKRTNRQTNSWTSSLRIAFAVVT